MRALCTHTLLSQQVADFAKLDNQQCTVAGVHRQNNEELQAMSVVPRFTGYVQKYHNQTRVLCLHSRCTRKQKIRLAARGQHAPVVRYGGCEYKDLREDAEEATAEESRIVVVHERVCEYHEREVGIQPAAKGVRIVARDDERVDVRGHSILAHQRRPGALGDVVRERDAIKLPG